MSVSRRERRVKGADSYDDINVDLTRLVFRRLLLTTVMGSTGMIGATIMLARLYHDARLWRIVAIMMLPCAGRIAMAATFSLRGNRPLSQRDANRWQVLYAGLTFLYCCAMSASTVYNFNYHPAVGGPLNMLGTVSICTGFASRAGMRPWVLQLCGLTLLLPMGLCILHFDRQMGGAGFMVVCLFSAQYCEAVGNQFRMVVEQLRSRRQMRLLSEQDVLTGLANRRHFEACLSDLCHAAKPFAILFIDLDRFKQVNDQHGHAVGDALLKQVSERLAAIIRQTDLVARLGGDEFAILQTPVADASSSTLAERINRTLAEVFYIDGVEIRIGASVGIWHSDLPDADPDVLLGKADDALYQVKQAGGGGFSLSNA